MAIHHSTHLIIDREILLALGEARLRESSIMFAASCFRGAMFAGGCALECFLKLAVCHTLKLEGLPAAFRTHNLEALLMYSGFRNELKAATPVRSSFQRIVDEWGDDGRERILYGDPGTIDVDRGTGFPRCADWRRSWSHSMVAKNPTVKAAESIDQALQEFVHGKGGAKVLVYPDNWGNLHAVVASGQFFGQPQTERQELVWTFLKERVPPEELSRLYRVHALTPEEYDACYEKIVSPSGEAEILDLKRLKKGTSNESNGS